LDKSAKKFWRTVLTGDEEKEVVHPNLRKLHRLQNQIMQELKAKQRLKVVNSIVRAASRRLIIMGLKRIIRKQTIPLRMTMMETMIEILHTI